MDNMAHFVSAYRQLQPVEKQFVDKYVDDIESRADKHLVRISEFLGRPVSDEEMDKSDGMLARPMVAAAIAERLAKLSADRELSPQRVVKEWMAIAFSSHADFVVFDRDGMPSYDLSKCTPEQLAAVKKIRFERAATGAERLEFETHDKIGALKVLTQMIGLLEPDNPYMRSEMARPVGTLDKSATVAELAQHYAENLE